MTRRRELEWHEYIERRVMSTAMESDGSLSIDKIRRSIHRSLQKAMAFSERHPVFPVTYVIEHLQEGFFGGEIDPNVTSSAVAVSVSQRNLDSTRRSATASTAL